MPHARFTIDVAEARRAPGIVAVWTGATSRAGARSCRASRTAPTWSLVATDTVRYVGEAVAVVVARTAAAAVDAAELVDVDYDGLPSVTDAEAALATAPLLHAGTTSNRASDDKQGTGDVDAAIAAADVVVSRRTSSRGCSRPRWSRGRVVAPEGDGFTAWVSTQTPHIVQALPGEGRRDQRGPAAGHRSRRRRRLRRQVLLRRGGRRVLAARELNRPVAWTATRSEDFQTTFHGRAIIQDVTIAATREGEITALDVHLIGDAGA